MGRLLLLFLLINVALLVVAIVDCLSTDRTEFRGLPKAAWVLVILLFPTVGPGVWFVAGRPNRTAPDSPTPGPTGSRSARPLGPDDDPEFLRSLAATTRKADEDRLRAWEDDLHRREEELRDQGDDSDPPGDRRP